MLPFRLVPCGHRFALFGALKALFGTRLADFIVLVLGAFGRTFFAGDSTCSSDSGFQRPAAGDNSGTCPADVSAVLT